MAFSDLAKVIQDKLGKQNEDIILDPKRKIVAISTGSLILDDILGGGMLIKGRITEVSGLESSGKTTLCLQSVASALKQKKNVLFLDFEQTFDVDYASALGISVNDKNLIVSQPANLEEGVSILRMLESKVDDELVIVIDSIAAAKPKKLLEAAGEQQQIGLHAQRIGELSGYLSSTWCGKKKAYVLLTNQIRRVPGTGSIYQAKAVKGTGLGFGSSSDDSYTTTGGNQLRYMCSVRLLLDYAGKIEEGSYDSGDQVRTGNYIKAFTVKNKVRSPFQTAKLAVLYGQGFVDDFAIIDTLRQYEYIYSSGAMFYYMDSNENDPAEAEQPKGSLSFKMKGKDAFYEKLKEQKYKDDMKKTFKMIMETDEAAELVEGDIEEDDFDDEE